MIQFLKRWFSGGMMLLPLFLLSVVLTIMLGGNASKGSPAGGLPAAPPREPGIKMLTVKAEISEASRPIQQIVSRTARFSSDKDSRDYDTVLMDDVAIQFFNDEGKPTGKASSPRGKLWLADNDKTHARRNDLLLLNNPAKQVQYRDAMQRLSTDSIFYAYSVRRLVSGPYKRYFQYGPDCYLATGLRMEAQMTTGTTRLARLREQGKPVTWQEIDPKDMMP